MATLSCQRPLEVLLTLEQRGKRHAFGLPQQIEVKNTWDGVGFMLGEQALAADMSEVKEILKMPPMTYVPGAKAWVKGIANVRGTLLPVMDLKGFLGMALVEINRNSRVLVVRHKGIVAGLLVDEVLGMQHFFEEEFKAGSEGVNEYIGDYVEGSYRQGGVDWHVFSLHRLFETAEFLQVAA